MKNKKFRKLAAAIAACTLMASAMPVVPAVSYAAKNIITNSTFDSGTADWSTYKESGGVCSLSTDNGRLALTVSNVGKVNYAVQLCYDVIPLYKNGVYRLKYDISSTQDRFIEAMIQQNGGTYKAYTWKGINLTSTPQTVDYEFTMEDDTDIMAKLVFNCGIQEKYEGELPEHTIYLDNVSLELVDDSNVDYSEIKTPENNINIDQVGYRTNSRKVAVLRGVTNQNNFSVINADTKQEVYSGQLESKGTNTSADEDNWIADFSQVTTSGKYYITCDGLEDSYTFEIGDNVYDDLLDDSVRMLYLQRCGTEVKDADFGHAACHNTIATIYGTSEKIDVSGGWHDAGDYGRYTVAAAKTVADLLYAYQEDPTLYSDSADIPESGNGIPDILDETRYELEWMLKMQRSDGGVYHKVTCENFPGYVAPTAETAPLIVTPVSSTATADFCASMALAAEAYSNVDADFAAKCLAAAEKAWTYLEANPDFDFKNPEDITTGEYGDSSDKDERYWAAAQMYRATSDQKYLTALEGMTVRTGLDWSTVGDYGNIAILTMNGIDEESAVYTRAESSVIAQADTLVKTADKTAYGAAITKYNWGSNMTIANAGNVMALAYKLTGNSEYLNGAQKQLDYLLGTNPLGTSFVTGYGSVSPQNPHHRPSMVAGKAMKGMLVGGVNQNLEDSAAKAYCRDNANAKRYIDNAESYSTNEIAIYWNSPLTYLLASTVPAKPADPDEEVTVWGDANCDGKVDVSDAVMILQSISNPDKYGVDGTSEDHITSQGVINGDVYDNGTGLTSSDALSIQKYIVELIPELPESKLPQQTTTSVSTTTFITTTTTTATVSSTTVTTTQQGVLPDYGTPMNSSASLVADFRKGATSSFIASDGWTNGNPFDCGWYEQNTSFKDGVLNLTIDKDLTGKYNYSGAEYRTVEYYVYGYYETSMQAIKNDGVVSSFFTYTGPYDGDPWDEIDIEILGKDTTKVQFNYYTNGTGNHEFMYDLGFDASQGFHTYGFDWQADSITWYVDGEPVYKATDNIPSTPGKIMMNTWPGTGVDEWLNHYNGNTPLTARYQWVTYDKK